MDEIDFDHVNTLLSVVHRCASFGPGLAQIGNAAQAELNKINASLRPKSSTPVVEDENSKELKPIRKV